MAITAVFSIRRNTPSVVIRVLEYPTPGLTPFDNPGVGYSLILSIEFSLDLIMNRFQHLEKKRAVLKKEVPASLPFFTDCKDSLHKFDIIVKVLKNSLALCH
jgi:hypothetical protein